ncbi:MAG: aminopeptidase N, partial [Alphaproteobacteria bacterium]|nr:aminopeptidase N [Alphaproteobacteria bacterium]
GTYCTQCEAEGFRRITYFIDRPDVMSVYTTRIEARLDEAPILLGNGNPQDKGLMADGFHYAVWHDPHPKPAYLFALVGGRLDHIAQTFTTRSGKAVELAIYVEPGKSERARYAMDALVRSMIWDEQTFGCEYDLDVFNIVAVSDFNMGAMENKGLNIFNDKYVLASPETATDGDYAGIESVIAHEYFHNWTGNRITCRDWFQLSLKEGLTVFRDQEFSADQRSRPVQRIKDVKRLRGRQFPEDAGPLAHPVRPESYQKIDNFYTATVYEKGAELIRMMKALIGAKAFDEGIQLYFSRHDGQACTVEQWLACFEESSGRSLQDFARWYAQAGTPTVTQTGIYDPVARAFTLTLRQFNPSTPGQPQKAPVPIPLHVGFVGPSGAHLAARLPGDSVARESHHLVLERAEQSFLFEGVAETPIAASMRGFSAPVILHADLTEEQRLIQMAHEPDAFTRWEAGQALARALLLARAQGAARTASEQAFAAALGAELDRAEADPAFAALALRLPDLAELVQTAASPDPEALFAARESFRKALADHLKGRLLETAARPLPDQRAVDAAASGRRSLLAVALDLLSAAGEEGAAVIEQVFDKAKTMTESMAALEALAGSKDASEAFERLCALFFERWRNRPLIIDKWFGVQAAAPHKGHAYTLALRRHPDFTLRNPNRVRALISVFALRNPRAFHAADGAGYRFVADAIAAVDGANPMLASRLAGSFESWRRFDPGRQQHARAALEALAASDTVSPQLSEVLQRTLGHDAA